MEVIPIIPVFNPETGLSELCRALIAEFGMVLVVDDGSVEDVETFNELPVDAVLIRHKTNLGKGRAIKTGIEWVRDYRSDAQGVVFVDGDGQHRVEDARRVVECAIKNDRVALGVRDFTRAGIPFRSRFGNVLTSFWVGFLYKIKIDDTQTGLRAIPRRLYDAMLGIRGERFEYEMRLFGVMDKLGETIEQVPIETIYIKNNRTSHFRPIRDSVRVYYGLFGSAFIKFCCSSFLGFVVDNIVFSMALIFLQGCGLFRRYDILIALVTARILSAALNYYCNRRIVFKSHGSVQISVVRYVELALIIAVLSYLGTAVASAIVDAHGLFITAVKIIVEVFLFLLSYKMQKKWVFKT